MAIDTKPNLNSEKFEQFTGDTLNLSGTTRIYGNLEYAGSAPLVLNGNTIVDKNYVDSQISTGITASNGLSRVGENIVLGGTLTGDTTIDSSTFDYIVEKGDTGMNITTFPFFAVGEGTGSNGIYGDGFIQLSGGSLVFVGEFTQYKADTVAYIVKVDESGTHDTGFTTNAGTGFDSDCISIAVDANEKLYVGGYFSDYNGNTANGFFALNSDGTPYTSFNTNIGTGANGGGYANTIAVQGDGKILVGGWWSGWNGNSGNAYKYLVRLNTNGTLDTGFTTNLGTGINSELHKIFIQSDGKIVILGYFTSVNSVLLNRIARLNSDGTLDTTFNTNIGSGADRGFDLYDGIGIIQQSTGKLVIGGDISTFNGKRVDYTLFRLNTDGTHDNTFNPNSSLGGAVDVNGNSRYINGLALADNDEIIVTTNSVTFNGQQAKYLFKLSSDASTIIIVYGNELDYSGFKILVDSQKRIYTAGYFGIYFGTTYVSSGIVRYTDGGLFNTTYTALTKNILFFNGELAYDADYSNSYSSRSLVDKGYIDNRITNLKGRNGLTRVADDFQLGGNLDRYQTKVDASNRLLSLSTWGRNLKFNAGGFFDVGTQSAFITKIHRLNTGDFYAAGSFTYWNSKYQENDGGKYRNIQMFVKLNATGDYYNNFNTGAPNNPINSTVRDFVVQSTGDVVMGGEFTAGYGYSMNRILRVSSTGVFDTTFNTNIGTGFNDRVSGMAVQADDKIVVVGYFTTFNNQTVNHIVRLNANGTLDTGFTTNAGTGLGGGCSSGYWYKVKVLPSSQKIMVSGPRTTYNGNAASQYLMLINTNGTLDTSFVSPFNGYCLICTAFDVDEANNKVIAFATSNFPKQVTMVNLTGGSISYFNTGVTTGLGGANNPRLVPYCAFQPDGKVIIYGNNYTTYNGTTANGVSRINQNGSYDTSFIRPSIFNPITFGYGNPILVLPDNKIMLSGNFYNEANTQGLFKVQSNGLLEAGSFVSQNGTFEYADDYSTTYTNRSLVDKGYVTTAIATATGNTFITANNGITKSGNNIRLGGSLTGETEIYPLLANDNQYMLSIGGKYDESEGVLNRLNLIGNNVSVGSYGGTLSLSTGNTQLQFNNQKLQINQSQFTFDVDNGSFEIRDLRTGTTAVGLEYQGDYSANYTPRSLVDKGYVDNLTGSGESVEKSFYKLSHGFDIGDVIEYSGSTFIKALAVEGRNSEVIGLVSEVIDVDNFSLNVIGYISGLTGTSANTTYYVSSTVAGGITPIEPTAVGTITKPILFTLSATDGIVLSYQGYVNVSGFTGSSGSNITAANGLSIQSDNVVLGGSLTGNTVIGNAANTSLVLDIDGTGVIGQMGGGFLVGGQFSGDYSRITAEKSNNNVEIYETTQKGSNSRTNTFHQSSNATAALTINTQYVAGSKLSQIALLANSTRGSIEVSGDGSFQGIQYNADYSANFTPRSLVDKAYVTGLTSTAASKVSNTITGTSGGTTTFTVTHNKNTRDVIVQVYEVASPYGTVIVDVERTTVNAVDVKFAVAPSTGVQYRVVII